MGHRVPWSDLPPELLSAIAKSLTSPLDIFRFRSVCKSWCSSVSRDSRPSNLLSPLLPLIAPAFPRNDDYLLYRTVTVISSTSVYILHAPIDESTADFFWSPTLPRFWLLFVDELNPGKLYIRKPLSKSPACPLPSFFPESLNLLDFDPQEVGKYCSLSRFTYSTKDTKSLSFPFAKPREMSSYVDKLVLFSNECGVLLLHDSKLSLSKLGENGFENWVVIHDGKGFKIDDIVDHKGRIYAVNRRGKVYGIDYDSLELNVIGAPISGGGGRRKRLVASAMGLYLVVRHAVSDTHNDLKFKVYVLKEAQKKWTEVSSLDDQIFFIGLDYSFSVLVKPFAPSCQGNSIIFRQYSFPNYDGYNDDSWLFRNSSKKDIHGVFHLEEGGKFDFISSYPIYSHMLWPPPFWLWANTKSMLHVSVRRALQRFRARIRDLFNKAKLRQQSGLPCHLNEIQREWNGFREFNAQIMSCCRKASEENKKNSGESGSLVMDVKQEKAKANLKDPLIGSEVGKTDVGVKDGHNCSNSARSFVKHIDWRECGSLLKEALKDFGEGLNSIGRDKSVSGQVNLPN